MSWPERPVTRADLDDVEAHVATLYGVESDAVAASLDDDGATLCVNVRLPARADPVALTFTVDGKART